MQQSTRTTYNLEVVPHGLDGRQHALGPERRRVPLRSAGEHHRRGPYVGGKSGEKGYDS